MATLKNLVVQVTWEDYTEGSGKKLLLEYTLHWSTHPWQISWHRKKKKENNNEDNQICRSGNDVDVKISI